MVITFNGLRGRALRLMRLASLLGAAALAGCATHYVDSNIKEISAAAYKKPAEPKPVQLLFEFQTKGTLNTRATDTLKAEVREQIKSSGLFSAVEDKPVADGALLSVTLNNVPMTDDAFTKGFVTGFTFGLVGSQVSDGYVCTANYLPEARAAMITKSERHAIHTTMGASNAPANGVKAESLLAAVHTMTRQIVSATLNDLAKDPSFK
ncbi:hypothetical protein BH11PSE8_BH11PSE8_30200 [soil metagenome]